MLEQRPRNGGAWRRLERGFRVAGNRSRYLVASEPARILELRRVDGQLARGRLRHAADHERRWKGPWLACNVADIESLDPGFLLHFTRDSILNGFADLDKAGERRIAVFRVMRLAAKQDPAIPFHEHDRNRIDAG